MIKVENLQKDFDGKVALGGVSFEIPPGQICGYLGPNGAGKSTTIKILTGVLQPSGGRATVAGFDVLESPLEVKKRVGYVPETGALYPMLSANEFLTFIGTMHDLDAETIVKRTERMLGLFDLMDAADKPLGTLSKGMKQKVVIASALLHDPEVVLFDEPLSGLDANAARVIKEILQDLAKRGKTIFYCSHMLDIVERLCSRVIILAEGQVIADEETRTLLESDTRHTLEHVFTELTGTRDHAELAEAFVDSFQNGGPSDKKGKKGKKGKK